MSLVDWVQNNACFSILPCRESNIFLLLFVSVACISLITVQYITLIWFKPKFAQLDPTQKNTRNYTLPTEWGSLIPLGIQSPILDVGRVYVLHVHDVHGTVLPFILFWPAVNLIRLKWVEAFPIQGKFSKKPQIFRPETIHCCDFFKE